MTKKRKVQIGIAVVLVVVLAFGGWRYYTNQQKAKEQAAAAQQVTQVTRMDIQSTVSTTGTIRPVNSVEVSSKITARIKNVLVKENDTVKAGQTVATLEGKDYESKRDQAQYKVTSTKQKYDRVSYLYSIGADTQQQLEDAQYDYDTAQSQLAETESDLAETVITAPMDGVVVGEPKTAGTMAVQGSDNPTVIMRIADLSSKQILAKVDETDIGNVKVGQDATFTVDTYPNKTFTAHVSKISQTDTANTWDTQKSTSTSTSTSSSSSVIYYYVTLDVDDPENELFPSMTARVDIHTADKQDALVVPISTLKTDANGSYVIVRNPDGSEENRYVSVGIYSDSYVEILSGLEEGEEVVSTYTATKSSKSSSSNNHRGGPPL